ncbi:MAG: hypothetical protein P0Y50_08565 [Candidatus Brevundimonas colombiensis]|jgi:hypothetical protein|uniref:Uncharacterized protein n=1 Tax=Candidatus Brevundimonas colombiensis TaxID=3121376 RepID=A0AAJ5WUQ6_9CAUL|nr:hypothetical protein [Brevundimonas sp.]WEK38606.1 MAG: hypothetical protein P0Y50_08565 [Brevundimonas sp.]
MTHPAMPIIQPQTEVAAPRVMHPVVGYGLAALIGAAFWASLLVAIF